jgi:hypothetical protein
MGTQVRSILTRSLKAILALVQAVWCCLVDRISADSLGWLSVICMEPTARGGRET